MNTHKSGSILISMNIHLSFRTVSPIFPGIIVPIFSINGLVIAMRILLISISYLHKKSFSVVLHFSKKSPTLLYRPLYSLVDFSVRTLLSLALPCLYHRARRLTLEACPLSSCLSALLLSISGLRLLLPFSDNGTTFSAILSCHL